MKISILSLQIVFLFALATTLFSCGNESYEPENPDTDISQGSLSNEAQEIYNKLNSTTWCLNSSTYDHAPLGSTITFSSIVVSKSAFQLFCSNYPNDIFAWVPAPDDGGDLLLTASLTPCNASNGGAFLIHYGSRVNLRFSGNKMTMTSTSNSNIVYVYSQSPSKPSTGGEDEYEKPDVGFYDYTQQGKSSVKVDFIIYNKDEAGVSSASIKYGTSSSANSSASTNIVGNHAIATISGLKSDTKYYVKCTVKGKGGSVTSDVVTISLSSW